MKIIERLGLGTGCLALVSSLALGSVACSAAEEVDDSDSAGGAQSAQQGWKGVFVQEGTERTYAFGVAEETSTGIAFALSLTKNSDRASGTTLFAGDGESFKAEFANDAKTVAKFKKGDCSLFISRTATGAKINQTGACTAISMPSGFAFNGEFKDVTTTKCWDVSKLELRAKGTCLANGHFADEAPAEATKPNWAGLYSQESTRRITAIQIYAGDAFKFSIATAEQNMSGGPSGHLKGDAHNLVGAWDDDSHRSATFEEGACLIKMTMSESGDSFDIEQNGTCTNVGIPDELSLGGFMMKAGNVCWDAQQYSFAEPGHCQANPWWY